MIRLKHVRLLALAALAFLIACSNDPEPQPQPAAPVVEQQAQAQTQVVENQQQDSAEPQQHQQPAPAQQATSQAAPQEQPQRQQSNAVHPPEPDFDVNLAIGYVEYLFTELGPRASGTEQEAAAARYLAETFADLGYEVEIQDFSFESGVSLVLIFLPDDATEWGQRFANSAKEEVEADLVLVPGYGEETDFAAVDVEGKIAMVDRGVLEFWVKAQHAEAAGAAALIVMNTAASDSLSGTFGSYSAAIPVLLVDSETRAQLLALDGQTASLSAGSPAIGESQNVIARKPGGQCRVIVGGHYDTVQGVAGASDNAAGTGLVLALAQTWTKHPAVRDVCFIGFGAEELGLHGSIAYVDRAIDNGSIEGISAMLNLDAIGNGSRPFWLVASLAVSETAIAVAAGLNLEFDAARVPASNASSDIQSFARAGVPGVFFVPQIGILHTPLDNLENFDRELFGEVAAFKHSMLACLLERAGSPISPSLACSIE